MALTQIDNTSFRQIIQGTPTGRNLNKDGKGGFLFEDYEFTFRIQIKEFTQIGKRFLFKNCRFIGLVEILNGFSKSIDFENCHFEDQVRLSAEFKESGLVFINCVFDKQVEVIGIYKLLFLSGQLIGGVRVLAGDYRVFHIQDDELTTKSKMNGPIHIVGNKFTGQIKIFGLKLEGIKMSGTMSKDFEVTVDKCFLKRLEFIELINDGKIRLFRINEKSKIEEVADEIYFDSSNLGKGELYNLNMCSFEKLTFKDSIILDASFINVNWPKNMSSYGNEKMSLSDYKDFFRQVKFSYSKQGNTVVEHYFHYLEMGALLKEHTRSLFKWKKSWPHSLQNWLVLFLSSISSRFGLSWFRPILFMLVVNLMLFSWAVCIGSVPELEFSMSNAASPGVMLNTTPSFIYFLNPIRKIESTFAGWGILLDILIRTVSSFSIYNFIRATRRFVK